MNNDYHFDIISENKLYSFELKASNLKDAPSVTIGGIKYSLIVDNEQNIPIIQEFIVESTKENTPSISEMASRLKHLPNITDVKMKEAKVVHNHGILNLLSRVAIEKEIFSSIDSPSSIVEPGKGSEMHHLLESWMEHRGFSGTVLVVDHGKTILKNGYGKAKIDDDKPITLETHFPIGSLTKPITCLAILRLIEKGHFTDLQTKEPILDPVKVKIRDFLPPSFQPSNEVCDSWKEITLLDLMNHTSGLPSFQERGRQIMRAKGEKEGTDLSSLFPKMSTPLSPEEVFDIVRNESISKRGTYNYSNFGFHLLGKIIEQVSGQSYETYMNKFLQEDLGLKSTGYFGTDQSGATYAKSMKWDSIKNEHILLDPDEIDPPSEGYSSGGLYSTVDDIHTLITKLMEGAIISPETVQKTLLLGEGGAIVEKDFKKERDFRQNFTCTTGWNITSKNWNDSDGMPLQEIWKAGAIGGYGSLLVIYPNQKSTIVVLSNQPSDIEKITLDLSNGLSVSNQPASETHPLSSWVGWYKLPWNSTFSIAQNGSKFVFRDSHPSRPEVELETSSTSEQIAFPWAGPDEVVCTHHIKRTENKLILLGPDEQVIGTIDKLQTVAKK